MSRAVNVALSTEQVLAACAKHGAKVSVVETLVTGGTRVVLTNGDGAAIMRQVFGRKLLTQSFPRSGLGGAST